MGKKIALIFGAAPQTNWDCLAPLRGKDPLVICADGGLAGAKAAGFSPAIYVGDGDSGGKPLPAGENICLPAEKDVTDLQAAYRCALAHGVKQVVFTGCLGGRQDHHIVNLQLLAQAQQQGIDAQILTPGNRVCCLGPGQYRILGQDYRYFSLLPLDECLSLTIAHAKYPLPPTTVVRGDSLTVSNEPMDGWAEVTIFSGQAWLTQAK